MNVQVLQNQSSLIINSSSVKKLVKNFTAFHQVQFDEASIHYVDTHRICELHKQFFNDPSPTDCISFPMDNSDEEGYRILGDVFVCPETALQYVNLHGGDVYQEVTLYTIHGLLHLLGYDDIEESENLKMKAEEARSLEYISAKKLWIRP